MCNNLFSKLDLQMVYERRHKEGVDKAVIYKHDDINDAPAWWIGEEVGESLVYYVNYTVNGDQVPMAGWQMWGDDGPIPSKLEMIVKFSSLKRLSDQASLTPPPPPHPRPLPSKGSTISNFNWSTVP